MDYATEELMKNQLFYNIPNDHTNYLLRLKFHYDFEPKIIYDIGSNVLHWTKVAERIWPESEIYCFDGFEYFKPLYDIARNKHKYYIGILSDVDDREVKWYENSIYHGGNSYYKERNDKVFPVDSFVRRKTKTLATVVKETGFPLPDLVKIDVQGAEYDIVKGSEDIIKHAKHLIVELQHEEYNLGAKKAPEMIEYFESLGFTLVTSLFSNNGPDGDYHFVNDGV